MMGRQEEQGPKEFLGKVRDSSDESRSSVSKICSPSSAYLWADAFLEGKTRSGTVIVLYCTNGRIFTSSLYVFVSFQFFNTVSF
jgi:hypothetical protein